MVIVMLGLHFFMASECHHHFIIQNYTV